jgi:hypothetical protein
MSVAHLITAAATATRNGVQHLAVTSCFADNGALPRLTLEAGARLGDNSSPVVRADFLLVGLDQKIERSRLNIALLGENALKGAHTQLRLRQL